MVMINYNDLNFYQSLKPILNLFIIGSILFALFLCALMNIECEKLMYLCVQQVGLCSYAVLLEIKQNSHSAVHCASAASRLVANRPEISDVSKLSFNTTVAQTLSQPLCIH